MNNQEKSRFIAERLASVVEKHTKQFKKENRKTIKDIQQEENPEKFIKFMGDAVVGSLNVMKEWEEMTRDELGGITALQYYESLDEPEDIIGLTVMLMEEKEGLVSASLEQVIKSKHDILADSILNHLESMVIDDSKKLNPKQKTVVYIASLLGDQSFLSPLSRIVLQFDDEKTDEDSIMAAMEVFKEVGQPSLQHLMDISEKRERKGIVYGYSLVTLAEIAYRNKSEDIYRYLKDCFRKSDYKFVEANALAAYGDGRAIAALRGYVERDIENIPPWEYYEYREIILSLGGMVSDLDEQYRDISAHYMHEHDHEHHHHEHRHHEH